MERFLSRCAEYIFQKHRNELDHLCLVFPNRRSGVFFNSYLQKQLENPVIGPHIVTVDELISGYSDLHPGEKLQLISVLYDIFTGHTGSSESFDDFYFWGEVLLADFSDIDHYLVNAKGLFSNLAGLKEIEGLFDYLTPGQKSVIERFWGSVSGSGKKVHHENFVSIWQQLYPVYADFKKYLREAGMAYSGMIARQVIDDFKEKDPEFEFGKYFIIGLNALNSCEKAFFNLLKQQGKATFLWDYDRFYVEDSKSEAGLFIRENLKLFPPPEDFILNTVRFSESKNIKLVAVSSNYGQAQEIPRFLADIRTAYKPEFDNTAVVLADEALLYPALGAIPVDFGTVNVTMGYPVRNSVVYGFLHLLIRLLKNKRLNGDKRPVAYYRLVTDILNHQLIGSIEPEKNAAFLAKLKKMNCISVPLDDINFSSMHRLIFALPDKVEDYCSWFSEILSHFYEYMRDTNGGNPMLSELIYCVYQAVGRLGALIEEVRTKQKREISAAVFFRLFSQYTGQVSVAFEGEPLSGLQVMGILETRCLDFKNMIILGLNENKWPRAFTAPSFIPFNLRKGFGLPGIDEQDSMYAYYFYRLVQRAENITATYSTLKEGIGSGELSRYGFQLKYDSSRNVTDSTLDFKFLNEPVKAIQVPGSPRMAAALYERNCADRPLSPSAIITWLQCSLRFYFRYVLNLPEPDEMKDEVDSPLFGNIFHEATENLYKPCLGKVINKNDIEEIRKDRTRIENEILLAVGKHFYKQTEVVPKTVKLEGKTVLIYENMKTFLQQLLAVDMSFAPFQLVSLEKDYEFSLKANLNGKLLPVRIGGKIDRVDRLNDILRIMDYKTGNVESLNFKDLQELFERNSEKPRKEILQALIYCLIYKESTGESTGLQPSIYSLRKLFEENFSPAIKQNGREVCFHEIEDEFTGLLQDLVSEIFSGSGRYSQTPHIMHCSFCSYNRICQRY